MKKFTPDIVTNGDNLDLSSVLEFIDSPATRTEIKKAVHRARHRRLDGAMDAEITAARFSPQKAIRAWIKEKDRSGDAARRNYPREVIRWSRFLVGGPAALQSPSEPGAINKELKDSSRALLTASRSDAASYRDHLKELRKPNGVRTVMSILGSFYSYLERNQYVVVSPFSGLSRPRRESRVHVRASSGQVPIMSDDEVHLVLEKASTLSNRVGMALGVMAVFGIRVGSVLSLEAGSDYIAFKAKGGETQRVLFRDLKASPRDPEGIAEFIKKNRPFRRWSKGACRVACTRVLSSIYKEGGLSNDFSPHDLRHAMAIREYSMDHDLMRIMRLLGHSNVATSQTYLEGIGILQKT